MDEHTTGSEDSTVEREVSPIERKIAGLEEQFFGRPIPEDWLRERNRRAAYHEAGHVVAKMFLGLETDCVEEVSIVPGSDHMGRVRSRASLLSVAFNAFPSHQKEAIGKAMLIELLAGCGAENRMEGNDDLLKLEMLYQEDETWEVEGTDFFRANAIAEAISRKGFPAYRVLQLAAKWTEEMLDLPDIWITIERVVGLLLQRGTIEAAEILTVCEKVRCMSATLPNWRRRLHPKGSLLRKRS